MRRSLVAVAALPLVAAACGGSSSSSPAVKLTPTAYVMQAAKKSSKAPSEHMEMSAATAVQGQQFTMTGAGDFDNTKRFGDLKMHANVQGVDLEIDAVLSGTTMYMRSPVFAAALPKGKTWMKIDLQKIGRSQGVDFSALMTQKPSSVLSWIQGSGDVTEVGDETVDGAATTHYRGRIDPTKIPQGAKIQKVAKAAYGPYDVWIGKDDGYVHRMRTSYSYATPAGGRQAIATTMTFSKFGEDVTVAVPAESETFDATTLSMKGLGG